MPETTRFTNKEIFAPRDIDRFWSKVERAEGCWRWLGSLNNSGYGTFAFRRTSTPAHRASYLLANGEIPAGLVLDHICRNRACVNPDHLEPVTSGENSRRSPLVCPDECAKGHAFTAENTRMYMGARGVRNRYCLTCARDRSRASMRKMRAKAS